MQACCGFLVNKDDLESIGILGEWSGIPGEWNGIFGRGERLEGRVGRPYHNVVLTMLNLDRLRGNRYKRGGLVTVVMLPWSNDHLAKCHLAKVLHKSIGRSWLRSVSEAHDVLMVNCYCNIRSYPSKGVRI